MRNCSTATRKTLAQGDGPGDRCNHPPMFLRQLEQVFDRRGKSRSDKRALFEARRVLVLEQLM